MIKIRAPWWWHVGKSRNCISWWLTSWPAIWDMTIWTRDFYSSKRIPQTFKGNHILTHFQYINVTLTFSEAAKAAGCFYPNYKTQVTLFRKVQVSLSLSANLEPFCVILVHHKLGKESKDIRVLINATIYRENQKWQNLGVAASRTRNEAKILGNVTISTDRKWNDQKKLNVILFPDDEGNDGAQDFGFLLELLVPIARKILSQII